MNKVEDPSGGNPIDQEFAEIFSKYLPQDLKMRDTIKVLSVGCGFAYEATGLLDVLPQADYRGIDTDKLQIEAAVKRHQGLSSGRFRAEVADIFQTNSLGEDNDLIIIRNPAFTANRSTREIQTSWTEVIINCTQALKIGGYIFLTSTNKAELEHTMAIINQDNGIQIINGITHNDIRQSGEGMPFKDDYIAVGLRLV